MRVFLLIHKLLALCTRLAHARRGLRERRSAVQRRVFPSWHAQLTLVRNFVTERSLSNATKPHYDNAYALHWRFYWAKLLGGNCLEETLHTGRLFAMGVA